MVRARWGGVAGLMQPRAGRASSPQRQGDLAGGQPFVFEKLDSGIGRPTTCGPRLTLRGVSQNEDGGSGPGLQTVQEQFFNWAVAHGEIANYQIEAFPQRRIGCMD